ncbi:MAG: EAL domain-containing protein [Spirochaetales bacterium]|nr:EAL domain-containing protein [Spirochaetales bacterium]
MKRTVLVVEDELVNSRLLGFILNEEYNVLYAQDGRDALEILDANRGRISMVLTDIKMPVMDGFELIRRMRSDSELGRIPVMVLTSESDYEEKSLELGAIDFLTKPYDMPSIIKARIRRIIELSEGRMIIQAAERDFVTGLFTREFFFEYARRLEKMDPDRQFDAVVIDLDRFHVINELYGRSFGNNVLKTVSSALTSFLGQSDGIGARSEKDIFFVMCSHRDSYDAMVEEIAGALKGLDSGIRFGLRVGVRTGSGSSVYRKFEDARNACNSVRKDKMNPVVFYSEDMYKKELLEERLLNEVQKALDEKQFEVWFQPKFNIRGEKPVLSSCEALVRWRHPELGMISPGIFIPLFEKNALIERLDCYVWKNAARYVAALKKKFGISVPVSVNVSRIDLFDQNLQDILLGIIRENHLDFSDFLLEITESAYSDDTAQLVDAIKILRAAGFRIEMDDFGSGYSTLQSLSETPVDIIKLDMSFTRRIHENRTTLRVVELIIDMAASLGVPVVAEGVENEQQYLLLRQTGCDIVQGYYFSKPLPPGEFEEFVGQRLCAGDNAV